MYSSSRPIALVIGLCSHGLAMARALNRSGVEVHALEANMKLPGAFTNSATIHQVKSIKDTTLVDDLVRFRGAIPSHRKIVLLPTNDNNVRVIAANIDLLKESFLISWSHCSEDISRLLQKSNIEKRCEETGLLYPKSFVIQSNEDISLAFKNIRSQAIIKPVQPQSGFKTLKCSNEEELRAIVDKYRSDLPFLIQEWIPGTDKDLYFGALYLSQGRVITRYAGRKLESFPPAMGQTTVAVDVNDDAILNVTEKFFEGLSLSGPLSLECKKDKNGNYWIIEPTIGRTDFWVGLCIASGCNLPYLEYLDCQGLASKQEPDYKKTIWFDSERDITAFPRHLRKCFGRQSLSPTFSFFDVNDMRPFLKGLALASLLVIKSLARRIRR